MKQRSKTATSFLIFYILQYSICCIS